MKTYNEIYVSFHVGRGGRFHNPGHITFIAECDFQELIKKRSSDLILCNTTWDEDKNEEVDLAPEDWKIVDTGSNVILEGKDEIEAKKGVLEFDTIYDKDYTCSLDECDDKEWEALKEAYEGVDGRYMSSDLVEAIKEYFDIEDAFTIEDLIGGIASFNADPFCIEDDETAQSILDLIDKYGYEQVTSDYEIELEKSRLDLSDDDKRPIYTTVGCRFVLRK